MEIRVYLITRLNQTLTYTVDLRSHVKQAAWNIKGKDLLPLHAFFSLIADELDAYAVRAVAAAGVSPQSHCKHRGGLHRHRAWG